MAGEALCGAVPGSVREVRVEIEWTGRRRADVDGVAAQMCERWFFVRTDGAALFPDATGRACETGRWSAVQSHDVDFHEPHWGQTETGILEFHVVTVPFRLEHVVERRGGRVDERVKRAAEGRLFDRDALRLEASNVDESDSLGS